MTLPSMRAERTHPSRTYHAPIMLALLALTLFAPSAPADDDDEALTKARREARFRTRRIIMNNDGNDNPVDPVTPQSFLERRTTPLEGSHVDSIFYCTGVNNLYSHRSEVTEQMGVNWEIKNKEWVKELTDQGTDSLSIMTGWCRERGVEIFWSMRMNDRHDTSSKNRHLLCQWKRDNPDLLMGKPGDRFPAGGNSWSALRYGRPEVREQVFRTLEDVCTRYDVDGVELDFFRHPVYFIEAMEGKPVPREKIDAMTALWRRVRVMADAAGRARGRPLLIAIRIPDSLDYCLAMGLDVRQWLEEDLVDIVTGGGYFKLEPWENLVALGRRYDVPVYAALVRRRIEANAPQPEGPTALEVWRGEAYRAWKAGVNGIYTFNRFDPRDPLFRELGDPALLETLDRVDRTAYDEHCTWSKPRTWVKGGDRFVKRPPSPASPAEESPASPTGDPVFHPADGEGFTSPQLVLDRCRDLLLREGAGLEGEACGHAEALSADGSWPDLAYGDKDPAGWQPSRHLIRTRTMALALAGTKPEDKAAAALRNAVNAALDHWIGKRYRSPNWWWNEIGVPRAMRDTVIALGTGLSGERRKGAIEVVGQHRLRGTGANLMWSAELALHHGCLVDDAVRVAKASDRIWQEITVGGRQGIQKDWSFFQHGPRLQMFHYGRGYFDVVCRIARQTQGTPFEMAADRRAIISDFLLEGLQWACRGPHTAPGTIDRAVSRVGSLNLAGLDELVRVWALVDRDRSGEIEAFRDRLRGTGVPLSGFRHFPRADFTVFHRPGGSLFLKTLSSRTHGTESINHENLKGKPFLHCGDHYCIRDGREYGDLQPLWAWNRLPGLTGAGGGSRQERRAFAGGLGNGASGLTAMDYARVTGNEVLEVRKLWAFHGDLVLCLLGGWEGTGAADCITTSVEQCRLRGPVAADGTRGRSGRARTILHGGFGYLALGAALLEFETRTARGSWKAINRRYSDAMIEEEVLHIDLPRGTDPGPGGFAIAIGADAERLERLASNPDWRILRNDRQCQCVRFSDGTHMAAFHAADAVAGDGGIAVDRPCLALWNADALWLCDPTHRGGTLSAVRRGRTHAVVLPPAAGTRRIDA